MSQEKQEMNLFEFLRMIYHCIVRFVKWVGIVVLQTIRLGIQYIWIVLGCALLGLAVSYWFSLDRNVKFKGESTILYSPVLHGQVEEGLRLYHTYLFDPNVESLIPPMTQKVASKVRKFETFYVIDSKNDSVPDYVDYSKNMKALDDTVNVVMPDRLVLRFKMKGNPDFSLFEESLVNFFNSQPAIVAANEQRKINDAYNLVLYKKEVARLDSFSSFDYFDKPTNLKLQANGTYLFSERTQKIYSSYLYNAMKRASRQAMEIAQTPDIINIQSHFVVTRYPMIYCWVIGGIIGVIVGLLVSLCVKYWKNIRQYLKK